MTLALTLSGLGDVSGARMQTPLSLLQQGFPVVVPRVGNHVSVRRR